MYRVIPVLGYSGKYDTARCHEMSGFISYSGGGPDFWLPPEYDTCTTA